jgi:hypothetical protein
MSEGPVPRNRRFRLIALFLLFMFFSGGGYSVDTPPEHGEERIITIVEEFKHRLGIEDQIRVEIVTEEKRLVSVRRCRERESAFLIRFHEKFLAILGDEELRAAIAHELGHVWIFTRRPYLHTEALANRQALLLISPDSLEKLYLKVAEFEGRSPEAGATEEAGRITPPQGRGLN